MGDLILLPTARHRVHTVELTSEVTREFYFDLGCPFSYLAAERVERLLGEVEWVAVTGQLLCSATEMHGEASLTGDRCAEAEQLARALRLPLSWPESSSCGFPAASRVALHAAESGAGARFALAAMRLAFCGGYDLEDPEIVVEAAAAAGLGFEACMAAARDERLDQILAENARRMVESGVKATPAVTVGDRWFAGPQALVEAVSVLRHRPDTVSARVPA